MTLYHDRESYEYEGQAEPRRAAFGSSKGSLAEALVRAAEAARLGDESAGVTGVPAGTTMTVADVEIVVGPNPPIGEYRVILVEKPRR